MHLSPWRSLRDGPSLDNVELLSLSVDLILVLRAEAEGRLLSAWTGIRSQSQGQDFLSREEEQGECWMTELTWKHRLRSFVLPKRAFNRGALFKQERAQLQHPNLYKLIKAKRWRQVVTWAYPLWRLHSYQNKEQKPVMNTKPSQAKSGCG